MTSRAACAPEDAEQAAFVDWLNYMHIPHFSVPNEGKRSIAAAMRLKRLGRRAGVPDVIIIAPCPRDGRPVAVEMKRTSGGKLSAEQKSTIEVMRDMRWHVIVAKGCQMAIAEMCALGFVG